MKLMMKRKIVLRLSILTVLLTFLWSCRNEDFLQADKNPLRNNQEFFTHSKNGDAFARAGIDYIDILEAYNREKDFLAQMPDQKGMPIWEKMQVVDAEGATGLMIPLSHDDETMSSVLFATIDEKNSVIGVKDYDNSLLEKIVYDGKIDQKFREQMFYTFMYVDNKTFGTEEFTHIPKDLFEGVKRRNEEYGRMKFTDFTPSPKVSTQQNGKVLLIENCAVTWHCTHHGGGGPCDYCSECYGMVCSTTMISVTDDPFPGTPGSSGSGGGGLPPSGPEGNIPSDDPCGASTTVFYRLAPGCAGSGNPDFPDLLDPCSKLKKSLKAAKELINKPQVVTQNDLMKTNIVTDTIEKGFYFGINSGEISPIKDGTSGGVTIDLSDAPFMPYGVVHNHVGNVDVSYANFSSGDINGFNDHVHNKPTAEYLYVNGYDGTMYVMTIQDMAAFDHFISQYPRTTINNLGDWKDGLDIKTEEYNVYFYFKQQKGKPDNEAYDLTMGYLANKYNMGIVISKKGADGSFQPIQVEKVETTDPLTGEKEVTYQEVNPCNL